MSFLNTTLLLLGKTVKDSAEFLSNMAEQHLASALRDKNYVVLTLPTSVT